ncbi:MAG: hypothetical protein LYZ70_00050 [Nitrososphaerales archaeon]|nr:hypothetical protein [Nitrososphaerales archaeon]
MRKALWAVLIIGAIIALDVVLANVPGPVPTSQAISNVERSASFQGIVGNGTYSYSRYSDNPFWDIQCVNSIGSALRPLNPFHEYTTTTLIFSVQPNVTHPTSYPQPANNVPFLILVQVNPASGEIYSIQTQQICV